MDNNNRFNSENDSSGETSHKEEMSSNLTVALPPAVSANLASNMTPNQPTTISENSAATTTTEVAEEDELSPPKSDFSAPPPYDVAIKLPTYEEVQREKTLQGEAIPQIHPQIHAPSRIRPQQQQQPLTILAIDTDGVEGDPLSESRLLLGTDFMFFTAFLVAFLFNWIGFLLLMCFCHTVASRYGALAGFGLSLTKWTLIVKHSTDLASRENSWLWWLIMAFGVLICVRAIVQYLNIKRGWRLLSGSPQEHFLFFY